uniref:Uncharacterized protein n=1 Tax=Magallana gigas TaxID=29159 RepID=A0A8W8NAL0_MAGGI
MDSIIEDVGPEALNDKFQDERTDSSDEDDIPLAELQSRIRQREERLADRLDERSDQIKLDPNDIKTDETVHGDVEPLTDEQLSGDDIKSNSDQDMSIVEVKVKRPKSRSIKAKGILGILLIVVCLIGIKCRKRIKSRIIGLWNAKGDSGEYKMSVLPTYAAVKTQGGDIPTLSTAPPAETEPTATLLPQQSPETLRMTAEHGPIYPNLPRFELITSRASSLIGSAPTSITE